MKIIKVLNNNTVSAMDSDKEVIAVGCGIGFGKLRGQDVNEEKIEKIFKIENENSFERFKDLIANLPLEYIRISDDIISYAKEVIPTQMDQGIYISLTDHISFAVERLKKGMKFSNILLHEVKLFYPKEFMVGKYAVAKLEQTLNIQVPEDEAASIALHIINAEFDTHANETWKITNILNGIMKIVKAEMGGTDGIHPENQEMLISQIKYLACRIIKETQLNGENEVLFNFVKNHYTIEYGCCKKVNKYLQDNFDKSLTTTEMTYFILDLRKILN